MVLWAMKTTLDIPDGLMRRVKLRAVHRNQKLKDAISQLLELGMSAEPQLDHAPSAPVPVKLAGRGPLTIDEIEHAIAAGRE
jgi:hypothetical protein